MKVQFVQSGGLLGAIKGCELETSQLAAEDAQELTRLVQASEITESAEALSNRGRDLQQYEIVIEEGPRRVSVVLDDATVPPSAKPLLGFLKKRARPRRPD
jgi:hypothetical protein